MQPLHGEETEFVEMFLDEARLAAGIHHPNVVPILEVGASTVGYYLVMEYVEGDTLARLLARAASKGNKLPRPITLRVALDMLAGLHAAHELRDDHGEPVELVHRDVSPQNILVGADGIGRITDFGVARAASRLQATRVGQLKGKLAYMAPEQASGQEDIDRRADVFSAGVVIWEALALKRLFKADNEAATLSRVMSEPVPPLRTIVPEISAELEAVIARSLDRDRDKRYASCAQFADALEAAAIGRDGIASSRDLAAYVREVMGDEIEQQRDAVRAWLARSEPSQVAAVLPPSPPSSSVSAAAMALPGGEPSRSMTQPTVALAAPRSRAPLVLGTLLLMGLVGVGGFLVARTTQPGPLPLPSPAVATTTPVPEVPTASASAPPAVPTVSVAPPVTSPEALATEPHPAGTAPKRNPAGSSKSNKKKSSDLDIPNPYR